MFRAVAGCLLCVLLLVTQALGEVKIARKHRVVNQAPGYCVWCALDTWGRHTADKRLIGFKDYYVEHDKRAVTGTPDFVNSQLSTLKIKFEYRLPGNKDFEFLKSHTKARRAVLVAMKNYPEQGDLHAVLLISATDEEVWFIDSNDIDWDWSYKAKDFNLYWTGWAVAIID